jgi:DNA-binding NtrC family response regulator
VDKYSQANGVATLPIAEATLGQLQGYAWPGNVRELENTMHRAVLFASGSEISSEAIMLPDGSRPDSAPASSATDQSAASRAVAGEGTAADDDSATTALVGRTVADVERELIIDTLRHCLGNRTHAANILGISIRTLRNKLKAYSEEGRRVPPPGEQSVAPA